MKKLLLIGAVLVAGYAGFAQFNSPGEVAAPAVRSDQALVDAFEDRKSDLQVEGEGVVTKILRDDNEGGRHQRFIVRLESGQTLLIAHNIDLAPRVSSLREGDTVSFSGEYEWSPKGGVIHWTHHDPAGLHPAGWLKHNGRTYQ
ncbi:MAG: DUF3465 domain-containing protein [Burkholderiales bacterium]